MEDIASGISKETLTSALWARIAQKAASWSALLTEYAATFAAEIGVMVSQIIVYKLAARFLGKEGFSQYAVARRTIAFIYPITLLGLTVALPRFIAHGAGKKTADEPKGYFGAAIFCVMVTTGVLLGIANLAPARVAKLFFGTKEFSPLVFPLSVIAVALALHTVTYAYFRGNLAMRLANAFQLVNLGLVPPLVFAIQRKGVRTILLDLGLLTLVIAGITIAGFTPWQEVMTLKRERMKELLRYGIQRLPGDLALLGLFTLPITITAHAKGVQQAGFLAFGVLCLTVVSSMFNPIGLILLPKASRMFATGASSELRHHVLRLLKLAVLLTGGISVALGIFAPLLIRVYLGPDFATAAGVIRFVVWGTVPYCLFLLLSHIIDAFHRNSVTAGIEIVAFVVSCFGCGVEWFGARSLNGFLVAFMSGVFTLGILSIIACFRIFRDEVGAPRDSGTVVATVPNLLRE